MVSAINKALIHESDEEKLLNDACHIAVEVGEYQMAWVGFAGNDEKKTVRAVAQAGFEAGYLETANITWADTERGRGPTGTAIRTGKVSMLRNILEDPNAAPWRAQAIQRGYRSSIALPLINDGHAFGALNIYSTKVEAFGEEEIKILEELTSDLAFGIMNRRMRSEHKLLEEESAKLKKAVVTSGEAIFMTDRNGIFTLINPGFTKLYGYNADEIVGKETPRILKSGMRKPEEYVALWSDLLAGRVVRSEHVNKARDGHLVTIESSANPIFDEKGAVVGFLAIQSDITKRKEEEEKLRRATRAMRALSHINELLVRTTSEQELLDKTCEIITDEGGYRFAWIGYKGASGDRIQPVAQKGFEKGYLESITMAVGESEYGERPASIALRTGKIYVVNDLLKSKKRGIPMEEIEKYGYGSLIAIPLWIEKEIMGVLAISTTETNAFDLEEMNLLAEMAGDLSFGIKSCRMLEEQKQAQTRLRELDMLKDKFIQTVSHQMRTPLSVIRWQLENLLEGEHGALNDYQEQLTRSCYQADLEVITRINDFLTALEIEEGRMPRLDKTPNCLENLWRSIEIKFKESCALKEIAYESDVSEVCETLAEIDMEKLRFVMEKLADNALIYTNDGGSIKVTIKQADTKIRFEITDTGVGIPATEQAHIFTRFYRASNAGIMKPDASGLSLYIAKHFIQAHDGMIGFESKEGKGSTFWFEIPLHLVMEK